jgi:hypothetical protein
LGKRRVARRWPRHVAWKMAGGPSSHAGYRQGAGAREEAQATAGHVGGCGEKICGGRTGKDKVRVGPNQ